MKFDSKIIEQLKNLLSKKGFLNTILRCRDRLEIPRDGFSTNDKQQDFINDKKKLKRLGLYTAVIIKVFELREELSFALFWYILSDKFLSRETAPGDFFWDEFHNVTVNVKKDETLIHIFPGARREDVFRSLRNKWPEIKKSFQAINSKTEKRLRRKDNRERDQAIYNLHKQKIFRADGKINQRNATDYFIHEGVDRKLVPGFIRLKDFKLISLDLPKTASAIKTVIEKQRKIWKNI
ncbi:MAG: hypothetical protein WCO18_00315 [bacterium]